MESITSKIRTVPNFPKPGIMYKDMTPLLADNEALKDMIKYFSIRYKGRRIDKVVGIESRGFILGSILALHLEAGFIPIRKANKLPAETEKVEYTLEYGTDALEIHKDAIRPGEKILLVDDMLATGGTAKAAIQLIENLGGNIVECGFLMCINDLPGRNKLKEYDIFTLIEY